MAYVKDERDVARKHKRPFESISKQVLSVCQAAIVNAIAFLYTLDQRKALAKPPYLGGVAASAGMNST